MWIFNASSPVAWQRERGYWGQLGLTFWDFGGARDFFKIDEKKGMWGSSSNFSEKFLKMINQHQYQQALCVLKLQKGLMF